MKRCAAAAELRTVRRHVRVRLGLVDGLRARTVSRFESEHEQALEALPRGLRPGRARRDQAGTVWVGTDDGEPNLYRIDPRKNKSGRDQGPGWRSRHGSRRTDTAVWAAARPAGSSSRNRTRETSRPRFRSALGAVDGTVASDGNVWIPLQGENAVARIDPATNTVVAKTKVGHGAVRRQRRPSATCGHRASSAPTSGACTPRASRRPSAGPSRRRACQPGRRRRRPSRSGGRCRRRRGGGRPAPEAELPSCASGRSKTSEPASTR